MENLEWNGTTEYSGRNLNIERKSLPTMRIRVITVAQLNEQSVLAYVRGNTFELESLEASPSEEGIVCRREFSKMPRHVFIDVTVSIGCDLLQLRNGMLTDDLV